MKKIFTLLLFSGIVSVSFAQFADRQRRYDNGNETAYGKRHGWNDGNNREKKFYYFSRREMQAQINQINSDYECKIGDVKSNRFMRPYKKHRLINELERRRDEDIKVVYLKFKDPCNKFDDHDNRNKW